MKILDHHVHLQVLLMLLLDFALDVAAYFLAAGVISPVPGWQSVVFATTQVLPYAVVVSGSVAAMGLYRVQQRYDLAGIVARLIVALAMVGTGLSVCFFLLQIPASRSVLFYALTMSFVFLSVSRVCFRCLCEDEVFRRRVLVFGAGARAAHILQLRRRSDQRGFFLVGFVPAEGDHARIDDSRVIADCADLGKVVREMDIDEIIIASDDRRRCFPIGELLDCKFSGVRVVDLVDFLERESGRVKVELLHPSWMIFSNGFTKSTACRLVLRLLDLCIGIVLFLVTFPVMVMVAVVIMVDDGFPFFYSQERVGLHGKVFTLRKFRSMRRNAESAGQAVWADKDDVRVTRTGRWLRQLRLDELPQLWSVLRGDMSLVGPRPERPEFVAQLRSCIPFYHERHHVKPGLTGWAQLCYPYGASENDALRKLEFDMYYVKNRSVVFYLMILLRTIEVVLFQVGSR